MYKKSSKNILPITTFSIMSGENFKILQMLKMIILII